MIRIASIVALSAAACLGVIGCGGSDDPAATTASGGQPSAASQQRMTDEAFQVVSSTPVVPVCNPGSLPNEDEETCNHFWNHMLAWKPITDATAGPMLEGAPSSSTAGAMVYGGFEALEGSSHWWGPNGLDGCTGNIKQNADYCKGVAPGLEFGKKTLIEAYDDGSAVKTRITWNLTAGDVRFGNEFFMAYNDGGAGETQYAFCSLRSGSNSGQWVSCSRSGDGDGAQINTDQPAGNDEDYASFGWVVENYPVLVSINNTLPDSRFQMESAGGTGVAFSTKGSTAGALVSGSKGATLDGAIDSQASMWVAGFRKRTGDGLVALKGRLSGTSTTAKDSAFNGAPVAISVEFAQREKTTKTAAGTESKPVPPSCKVSNTNRGGDTAKCSVIEFIPGGVSTPGILQVAIQPGSQS